jgi:hypothetical protein
MNLPPLAPTGGSGGPAYGKGWDLLKLGGVTMPGLWKVVSGGVRIKLDEKKKPGADGGNPVMHGMNAQAFEVEGRQWTDEQRALLVDSLTTLLPQPGASQNQIPIQLQHPSVYHFGFAINVIIVGCGILEYVSPCETKLRISLHHWLPQKANAKPATTQPTYSTRSKVTDAKDKQNPPNPPPHTVPGAAGPPAAFSPGQ